MPFDAYEFDEIARNVFAPAYPLLASQIIANTGVAAGNCLDMGSGGGYLGLALAESTDMHVCLLDESADMCRIAAANIDARNLTDRVRAITGDAHDIPLPDDSVHLVASRSSLFFWDDLPRALREVWRVLVPGGHAYIGGGFGSRQLREEIMDTMRRRDPGWAPKFDKSRDDTSYAADLAAAGITEFKMTRDESGFWITFQKRVNGGTD
jgi:SAM-dependent methyltransferase